MPCCYAFEVNNVQGFILESAKLKDMAAASELVERLCGTLAVPLPESDTWLWQALQTLGLGEPHVRFSRRGGGAFVAFFEGEEEAVRFRDLWSFTLRRGAPGLEFSHALVRGDDPAALALHAVERLRVNRGRRTYPLPLPGPLVARAPRTGRAAVRQRMVDGRSEREDETQERLWGLPDGPLAAKLAMPGPDGNPLVWPAYMEPGPEVPEGTETLVGKGEGRYVAVLHADGNGMGGLIARLADAAKQRKLDYVSLFRAFSTAVEEATVTAARGAIAEVLGRHARGYATAPARFLVLAGDDVTLVIRGDLALPFAESFLARFEERSGERLAAFLKEHDLPEFPPLLSAAAGIAYIKANQPFHMAYRLSESLCREAKRAARAANESEPIPSALAFHRVTTALIETYPAVVESELTGGYAVGNERLRLSLGAYGVGERRGNGALPRLADLKGLAALLASGEDEGGARPLSRGAVRELLRLLHYPSDEAMIHFARWREQLHKLRPAAWQELDEALSGLLSQREPGLAVAGRVYGGGPLATPLGDALTYATLAGKEE